MGAYGEAAEDFEEADVRVVAVTAEGEEKATAMEKDEDLPFPVLHDLDVDRAEERLGLWVKRSEKRIHVQPAQFILRPDGTVEQACYQSGPVGRLGPEEALSRIRSVRDGE